MKFEPGRSWLSSLFSTLIPDQRIVAHGGSRYRPDIDGLRAIAVMSVILFHVGFEVFSGGYVGVDVFFVISGFLITRIIVNQVEAGTFSFTNFYIRRVRRLFPALFFTLALCFIGAFFLFSPQYMQRFGGSLIHSILSASNFYFWSESGYFNTASDFKPLLHTWSLSVEEQFYMVWPATLVLLMTKIPRWVAPVFLVLTGLVSLYYANLMLGKDSEAAFYLTPFRIIEFAIGALVVWIIRYQPANKLLLEPISIVGLALIAYSVFFFTKHTPFPGVNSLIPAFGAALLIYGGTAQYSGLLLRNAISVWIGLISYSLYLIHWPLIVFYKYYKLDSLGIIEMLSITFLSLLIAALMYRFIEQPYRSVSKDAPHLSPPAFGLVCAMLALLVIFPAASAWANSGWSWRTSDLPKFAKNIKDPKMFHRTYYGGAGCKTPRCEVDNKIPGSSSPLKKLYVIGDSHSRAYYKGIAASFKGYKAVFWESGSCQFFSKEYIWKKKLNSRCSKIRKKAFADISRQDGDVIIAQSWSGAFGGVISETTGKAIKFKTRSQYVDLIVRELEVLRKNFSKRRLIIIGGVPRFGSKGAPLDCISRPFLRPKKCKATNISNRVLQSHLKINRLLKAKLPKDIIFLDPFDALCSKTECRNINNGLPLYSDNGHLSIWGSRYVANVFYKKLKKHGF